MVSDPVEVSGVYAPDYGQEFWPSSPVGEMDAVANAVAELGAHNISTDATIERIAYWDNNRKPHPCFQVSLNPAMDESYYVFVSAVDGRVLRVYDRIVSGSAAVGSAPDLQGVARPFNSYLADDGNYYAVDISLAMYDPASQPPSYGETYGGSFVFSESGGIYDDVISASENAWEPTAVSAQYNMNRAYDYFETVHGRSSFDGQGSSLATIIHYGDNLANAFWNGGGRFFAYGDGGSSMYNLAGSLDICAHEYTHGVVTYSANLIYESQPGALNEHFADLFAAMVDREDWLIGEDVMRNVYAMRDMAYPDNPALGGGIQPATMCDYANLTLEQDHGGVHINSGIPNHMAYILSDVAPAIGRNKLELLAYRALNYYLVQRSEFIDYRRAMVSAAQDLYGVGSVEVDAVEHAFNAVAIFDDEATPDPITYSGFGEEQTLFLYADGSVYNSDTDSPYLLGVNTAGGNYIVSTRYAKKTRPQISGDAEELMFLDTNGDICVIDSTGENTIDLTVEVQTISVSKNGRYLTFTYPNTSYIVLYDSVTDSSESISLEVPNPDGENTMLENPDIVTFSPSADRLVFDATSKLRFADGNEYDVWGIYSMRIADKRITPVWQPSQGGMFGNPHFSNLHPNMIVADMVDIDAGEVRAISVNMWNQKGFALTDLDEDNATPSCSGLDNDLIFVEKGWLYHNLYSAEFVSGELNDVSTSKVELYEQSDPIVYPVGFADNPAYMAPEAEIIASSDLDFSLVEVGRIRELEFLVANSGTAMLELYDMHLVGAGTNEFNFIVPVSLVAPGDTVSVTVRYSPKTVGQHTASIKLFSTDPDQKETTVLLSGEGYSLDADGDGMLDAWELEVFGTLNFGEDGDFDDDGLSNRDEFLAGTHPTNKASCLRINSLNLSGSNLQLEWCGGTSVLQRVLSSHDLSGEWSPVYTNYPPMPVTNSTVLPSGHSNAFFKVEAGE